MDETTTDAATQDNQGVDTTTQPVEQPAEAVQTADGEPTTTTTEPTDTSSDEPANADNSDDELTAWASKKGVDLSTPEGQTKALKSWREAEKKMHESRQQTSVTEAAIGSQATADGSSNTDLIVSSMIWKQNKSVTPEQDTAMGEYLTQNPLKLEMLKQGLTTFDEIFLLSGAGQVDVSTAKKEGGKAALETLANKQRATSPTGNASMATKPKVDPIAAALAD